MVLVDESSSAVVAHCRLQPACENADGFSAAITSVVVDPARRGQGIGRKLPGKMVTELAILGFVSFTATVILQFVHLDEETHESFEYAHVLMFITVRRSSKQALSRL